MLPGYLFSLLLLAGCQNMSDPTTGTTRVSGQVVESVGRKPVPNATVQVWHESTAGGYRKVGSGYAADAQGKFAFDFVADDKYGYIVLATAPPGYITDWQAGPSLTAGRTNEGLTIPTLAPAWVKLQLVDEPPKNRVVIHTQGYEGSGDTFYYPRDTVVIRPLVAGSNSAVFWWINDEKGQTKADNTYFKSRALDTVTVRIPF